MFFVSLRATEYFIKYMNVIEESMIAYERISEFLDIQAENIVYESIADNNLKKV